MSDFHDYEFTFDTVTGVRGYRQDSLGRLTGVTHRRVMKPGVNQAECRLCGTEKLATCDCGYWAYFPKPDVTGSLQSATYGASIGAIIRGTGRIVVGTKGFRAEKAEILALFPIQSLAKTGPINRFTRHLFPTYEFTRKYLDSFLAFMLNSLLGIVSTLFAVFALIASDGPPHLIVGVPMAIATWYLFSLSHRILTVDEVDAEDSPRYRRKGERKNPLPVETLQKLYPKVPIYRSFKEAAAAWPLTDPKEFEPVPPPKPTPQNTDNFWDLPDPEGVSYTGSGSSIRAVTSSALTPGSITINSSIVPGP
jgi:hypothetical protein